MKRFVVLLLTLCMFLTACAEDGKPAKNEPPVSTASESSEITHDFGCTAPAPCKIGRKHYIAMVAENTAYGITNYTGYDLECYRGICNFIEEEALRFPCTGENDCRCNEDYFEFLDYYIEEYSTENRISCIEQAIKDGAEVIVLPGYSFAEALIEMQEKYPEVYFLGIDIEQSDMTVDYIEYHEPTPNAACVNFASEEAGWLAGYACVKEGYRKLGFASTYHIPQVINYGYGFLMGADVAAQELGVDIEMRYGYDQHPYCTEPYHQMVCTWCEEGTEVILECFPESIDYIVDKYDCRTINCDTFDFTLYDCLLSAAEKNLANAVHLLLSNIYSGTWENYGGKFTELSLADGEFLALDMWDFENFTVEDYEQVLSEFKNGSRPLPDITDYNEFPTLSEHTTLIEYRR